MMAAQNYTFTVPAGGSYRLQVGGEFFKLLAATGKVRVDSKWGRVDGMTVGQGLEKSPYDFLNFTDQTGNPNIITVLCAGEYFLDGSLGNVQITTNKVAQSALFTHTTPALTVASTQILAANPARQYLAICNKDGTAIAYVNLSGAAATVANGIQVPPGQPMVLENVVPTTAITWIGSAASANMLVVEG